MTERYAVLTGDIIKSRKISPRQLDNVRSRFSWCVDRINSRWDGLVIGEVDFFRGDGWQMLVSRPDLSITVACMLRSALIGFEDVDTRVAVGVGQVEHFDPHHISQSTGQAFERSGKALDGMKKRRYLDLFMDKTGPKKGDMLLAALHLCDALTRRFSSRQAEAVFWALQGLTHSQIAENMTPPIQRHTVTDYLNMAGWEEIENFIDEVAI